MLKNEYTLNVDLKQKMSSVTPTFVQYDNATLVFRIFDNGKPFDLTGFTKAEVSHKQPDGHTVIGSATILKNSKNEDVISYSYLGSEMSKIGIVGTSLSLFSGDKKVSIQPFNVVIVSENRDSVVDVANPEYGLLQELIVDIELISLNANAQATHALIEGNYAKKQGDYAKEATDSLLIVKSDVETAEVVRVTGEDARKTSESTRISDESTRKTNETDRINAESSRATKENTRTSFETTREQNEAIRLTQEASRQTNTQTAITGANQARDDAKTQANYTKQVADANKNVPLSPVATFAVIATTYPNPIQGSKVQVTTGVDAGKIYRREGSSWNYVEKMDSNMLSDIQTKINLGVIEVNATTPANDVKLWLDIGTV